MKVGDFDILSPAVHPPKTDAELIVDPDRMLSSAVLVESMQFIPGWSFQIAEIDGMLDHEQFPLSGTDQVWREAFRNLPAATASVFLSRNDLIIFPPPDVPSHDTHRQPTKSILW